MQQAESFVLLAHYPLFLVELHIDNILRVLSIVDRVVIDPGWFNCEGEGDLEEEGAVETVVLAASLHVFHENLCGEEDLTEFALHGLWMLENALEELGLA